MLADADRGHAVLRPGAPPVDAGFFETEHHAQVSRDIRAAIMGGRLIALTAVIGSGKTILSRRLRADLEREGRVIVSRSLSIDKAKISLPLLEATLFYDLTPEKTVKISSQSERRERDLQELFRLQLTVTQLLLPYHFRRVDLCSPLLLVGMRYLSKVVVHR